jgi:HPt (histidine-containing phosphotransfer) domain-containing protein
MTNIDLSYLKSVTDGDEDLIKELVDIFKTQVPEYLTEFNDAFEQKDTESLSKIAHKSKSSVAIMGLSELAEQLSQLEKEAKEKGFSDDYKKYILLFEEQCNGAIEELNRLF